MNVDSKVAKWTLDTLQIKKFITTNGWYFLAIYSMYIKKGRPRDDAR